MAEGVVARCYTSPSLILLAMDWATGADRADFLGFANRRAPGFAKGERDADLTNKIGFSAPGRDAQPLPSNIAPFQTFLRWDAGIDDGDSGKTFRYTITPVCGTNASDLHLQHDEHDRARAIWNETSGKGRGRGTAQAFTLKTTRDGWVRGAYKTGTPEALARTTLARGPGR